MLSIGVHIIVMYWAMDEWIGMSKLALFYSFQYICLHLYIYAVSDRRYSSFIQDKISWFYISAGLNLSVVLACLLVGVVMAKSPDGMVQVIGIGLIFL